MSRTHRSLACVVVATLMATSISNTAVAALAPGTVKKMKDKATDVLEVKITKVEKTGASADLENLVYTATVLKVDRSKSGRKAGDSIQIASYRVTSLLPLIGPKAPPEIKPGWVGTIYLNAPKADGPYALAVFGHSFIAKGE